MYLKTGIASPHFFSAKTQFWENANFISNHIAEIEID